MKYCNRVGAFLVCAGISVSGAMASPSELIADPSSFAAGVEVSTAYPGLVLSQIEVTGELIETTITIPIAQIFGIANPVGTDGTFFTHSRSFPNLWTLAGGIALRADFSQPVTSVSVEYAPDDTDSGVLQAYATNGDLLGQVVNRLSVPFVLTQSGFGTPIGYVIATYGDTGRLGAITYQSASPVPEAESYQLLLAGLFTIAGILMARQNKRHPIQARPIGRSVTG